MSQNLTKHSQIIFGYVLKWESDKSLCFLDHFFLLFDHSLYSKNVNLKLWKWFVM